jgi:hypothetical protein
VTRIEVGAQDGQVVIFITVGDAADPGTAQVARVPLSPDEARYLVNWVGEALVHIRGPLAREEAAG